MPCPLPPLWGGACGRFGWPRPACVGQCVLQRYGMVAAACWQECHRYVLVTIQNMMLLFSPCKRCPVPALMRFSAPVKKHWLGSFSIVLPPSGLCGFVPVVRDRWEQGRPGGRGPGGGGGGGPGPESIYTYICIETYTHNHLFNSFLYSVQDG